MVNTVEDLLWHSNYDSTRLLANSFEQWSLMLRNSWWTRHSVWDTLIIRHFSCAFCQGSIVLKHNLTLFFNTYCDPTLPAPAGPRWIFLYGIYGAMTTELDHRAGDGIAGVAICDLDYSPMGDYLLWVIRGRRGVKIITHSSSATAHSISIQRPSYGVGQAINFTRICQHTLTKGNS